MDLNTKLPGPVGIAGRATGRICCDPALGFADQSIRRAQPIASTQIHCDARLPFPTIEAESEKEARKAFGWDRRSDIGEDNALEETMLPVGIASGARDRFLEGCLRVQEDERLRMGRELHDSTGQLLLALRLNLARLRRLHGSAGEDDLIDEIENTACQIDREIRSFSFLHYPAEIEKEGLSESLRFLTRGFAARTGLKVKFEGFGDGTDGHGPGALALLRVAQEALMNVHRHASASHVRVTLKLRDRLLELIVRDDGVGFPVSSDIHQAHGVGMPGMRHRVERLGGHFAVKRMKHGTKLIASVPAA